MKLIITVLFSLFVLNSNATTIEFTATVETNTGIFPDYFGDLPTIFGNFEFDDVSAGTYTDPGILLVANFVVQSNGGAFVDSSFCFTTGVSSAYCDELPSVFVVNVYAHDLSITFDENGYPIAGSVELDGLLRSPWPYELFFDFTDDTFVWEYTFGDMSGELQYVVPLPSALFLLLSACGLSLLHRVYPR